MGNAVHKRILKNILVLQPVLSIYKIMAMERTLLILAGCYIVRYKVNKIDGPKGITFFGKLIVETVMRKASQVAEREYNA